MDNKRDIQYFNARQGFRDAGKGCAARNGQPALSCDFNDFLVWQRLKFTKRLMRVQMKFRVIDVIGGLVCVCVLLWRCMQMRAARVG